MVQLVRVGGTIDVPRALLSSEEIAEDERRLSAPNPARVSALRRGDPRAHLIPSRVSALVVDGDRVRYPWGARELAAARITGRGARVLIDQPRFLPSPLPCAIEPTPYQRDAVDALAKRACGIVVAPPGAGKGEIIVLLAARLGVPTLILVGQIDHAVDLRERVRARLGLTAGLIGSGEKTIERITIALVQALDEKTLDGIAGWFGAVLVDECHHVAAASYATVLRTVRAPRRYGVTATIRREDGLTPIVHALLGPVVHETTRAELVAVGRSVVPAYRPVHSSFDFVYSGPDDWRALLDALARSDARDDLIADQVVSEGVGELTAVLVGRVDHVARLTQRLRDRGLRASPLTGRLAKKQRAKTIDDARSGALDVLVGTQLLDEGIDIPRLSRVVLAWPARAEGRLVQRVGRTLRVFAGKARPLAIDVVDDRVGVLRAQAAHRRRAFDRAFRGGES